MPASHPGIRRKVLMLPWCSTPKLFVDQSLSNLYKPFMKSLHKSGRMRNKVSFLEEDKMCGCMLMHTMMNHEEHQPVTPSTSGANSMAAPSRQHCIHCGFPLQQGFAFCPGCGMSIKTTECPACGKKVDPAWKACAYCGSPLGEVQGQTAH